MTDIPPTARPAGPHALPPWVGIALIVSLCLNFIAIGAVSVMFWRMRTPPQPYGLYSGAPVATEQAAEPGHGYGRGDGMGPGMGHGRGPGRGYGRGRGMGLGHGLLNPHILATIVPERADEIRKILDRRRDRLFTLRRDALTARTTAAAMLQDPQFTQKRFDDALATVRKADNALEAEVLDIVSECVSGLSPEERQAAALRAQDRRAMRGPVRENGRE